MSFIAPKEYINKFTYDENGVHLAQVNVSCWFTNLLHSKRNEELILVEKYSADKYPKYDNYDAINVDKTRDIPMDYEGVMGVPITFLDKYCPEQFEIVDINPHFLFSKLESGKQLSLVSHGLKDPYARILIRNRKPRNDY